MASLPVRLTLMLLLASAMQAEAGQSYSVHGYARPGNAAAASRGNTHQTLRNTYRSGQTSVYGGVQQRGGYGNHYPSYPVYPAYPVYPVQPYYGYRSYAGAAGYRYDGYAPLPSTHTYGYYDFGQRRKCLNACSDSRHTGRDHRHDHRDGRRDRHDGHGD